MVVKTAKGYIISHNFNGNVVKLYNSLEWTIWLNTIRGCSTSTINMYARTMERFWVWSLYNKPYENEKFAFYFARFREALLQGYEIVETVFDDYLNQDIPIEIITEKPKTKQTINKSLVGIKSYMYYLDDSSLVENKNFVDIFYENKRSKHGMLGALDIKKSNSYLELFGKRQGIIKPYKIAAKSSKTIKAFPYKSFNALLKIANAREKLLYLLMGACSARIGQAINLTLYDIDFENEEIWLLDPTSDNQDIYGNFRKKWLFNTYGIDTNLDKEHNDLTLKFKYPIPLKHEPLYWINDKYKKMFFKTAMTYLQSKHYVKEQLRDKPHPFFFVTKSGRRLMPRSVSATLKRHLKTLNDKGHDIPLDLGSHSFRHMFGVVMSEVYAELGDESILFLTKEAMGHSKLESTLVYFNMTDKTKRNKIKEIGEKIFNDEEEL
jgi:integrase